MNQSSEHIQAFDRAYFIGVGGIGMSALARYFRQLGWSVAGYDKTPSPLTAVLETEGVEVHYEDLGPALPDLFQDVAKTLVVYTPAVPVNMGELMHVKQRGYVVKKRAEVLGMITRNSKALAVAGTHGKTTTSTLLAHLLNESSLKCNAFLGGIATNFNSNFVQGDSDLTVVEADEFDRSFLQLNPFASIITSTDADHLDIYGDEKEFISGFEAYVNQISPEGSLIRHHEVKVGRAGELIYGIESDVDYNGRALRIENGRFLFDLEMPDVTWEALELGVPGIHNAENAIACIALCRQLKIDEATIRSGLKSFAGVKRRFEYHIREENTVYIDDYAHHPTEIHALITSVRLMYPNYKITGVFQPHLFSRTRDFFEGFVQELGQLDELILLPIYPAREEPIAGITSDALLKEVELENKRLLSPEDAVAYLSSSHQVIEPSSHRTVVLTIGAGDIDRIVLPLKEALKA